MRIFCGFKFIYINIATNILLRSFPQLTFTLNYRFLLKRFLSHELTFPFFVSRVFSSNKFIRDKATEIKYDEQSILNKQFSTNLTTLRSYLSRVLTVMN